MNTPDRTTLRHQVEERLVMGSHMDEIAATRLVTALLDAWRAPRAATEPTVTELRAALQALVTWAEGIAGGAEPVSKARALLSAGDKAEAPPP